MNIEVVYLLRNTFHKPPFLEAYGKWDPGVEHSLTVVAKGATTIGEAVFRGAKIVSMADWGQDTRAYRLAAERSKADVLCFLNTWSEPVSHNWLRYLVEAVAQGWVAGCSGSYESMRFHPPFPNPHLRTNAFALGRERFLKVWPRWALTKRGAMAIESGKNSFTQMVGNQCCVVGANGMRYPMLTWRESMTFRSGGQRNLLVADKQTNRYRDASPEEKARLEKLAWGREEGVA